MLDEILGFVVFDPSRSPPHFADHRLKMEPAAMQTIDRQAGKHLHMGRFAAVPSGRVANGSCSGPQGNTAGATFLTPETRKAPTRKSRGRF